MRRSRPAAPGRRGCVVVTAYQWRLLHKLAGDLMARCVRLTGAYTLGWRISWLREHTLFWWGFLASFWLWQKTYWRVHGRRS